MVLFKKKRKETETDTVQENTRIWTKSFINIFIVHCVMCMGTFMGNSLIPKYADFLGASATVVGVVSGIFAVTALGVRPVAGPAIDYFKKDRLLSAALGVLTLAYIVYGCAGNITVVIIARLLQGVAMGFTGPLGLALASDILPRDKMASGIGVYSLGQAVSTAIGPLIGLKLAESVGYNMAFFIGAAVLGCSCGLSLCLHVEAPAKRERFKISLDKILAPEVIFLSVIMLFLGGAYACISSFIVIYGELCGVEDIALFFTVYAISLLVSRPFTGKISDKYGLDKTIVPGMLIFGLAFLLISFSRSLPMFLLASVFSAFGYGVCQPSIQTLCMQLVPSERRGAAGNTNYIGVDTGHLIMPTLAGMLVTHVQKSGGSEISGYTVMFWVMMIPIGIALAIFLLQRKKLLQRIK